MTDESKLPADLFDIFKRYKRATGKVLKWLALTSGAIGHDGQTFSLEALKQAAEIVKEKAIEVPEIISYAFRDAIRSRSEISLHFKRSGSADSGKTRSHEFFTRT